MGCSRFFSTSSDDEISLEDNIPNDDYDDDEVIIAQPACWSWSTLLWVLPAVFSFNQASQVAKGVSEKFSPQASIPYAALAFFASLAMTGKFAVENIKQTVQILKNGKLPDDWPKLSKQKRIIALVFASMILSYVVFADGIQSDFYTNSLPDEYNFKDKISMKDWKIFCILIASIISATTLFSEGVEAIKGFQELFSDAEESYHTDTVKKWISIISAGPIAVLGAIGDGITSFDGMLSVFKLVSFSPVVGLIAAASMLNMCSDFCLSGRFNISNVYNLLDRLSQKKPEIEEIISFTLSMTAGGLMGYAIQNLILDLANNLLRSFEIEYAALNILVSIISFGSGFNEMITDTGALYNFIYPLVQSLGVHAGNLRNYFSSGLVKAEEKESLLATFEEEEDDIELGLNQVEKKAKPSIYQACATLFCQKQKIETPIPTNDTWKAKWCTIV